MSETICIWPKCRNVAFRVGLKHCYRHVALTVSCDKCGAEPDQVCLSANGRPNLGSHAIRVKWALLQSEKR